MTCQWINLDECAQAIIEDQRDWLRSVLVRIFARLRFLGFLAPSGFSYELAGYSDVAVLAQHKVCHIVFVSTVAFIDFWRAPDLNGRSATKDETYALIEANKPASNKLRGNSWFLILVSITNSVCCALTSPQITGCIMCAHHHHSPPHLL